MKPKPKLRTRAPNVLEQAFDAAITDKVVVLAKPCQSSPAGRVIFQMIVTILTVMLVAQSLPLPAGSLDQPDTVSPAIIAPRTQEVPTDHDLTRSLNDLVKSHPDQVVCLQLMRTGSHRLHRDCRTIRGWYDYEAVRRPALAKLLQKLGVADNDVAGATALAPPYELLQHVKDRYRSPSARAAAKARALERTKAEARRPPPAAPTTSHP